MRKLTSRHNPHSSLADGKRVHLALHALAAHLHHDFAFVHEEAHLHLATILRALEAFRRKLHHAASEEWHRHDFGVFELRASNVAGYDRGRRESQV